MKEDSSVKSPLVTIEGPKLSPYRFVVLTCLSAVLWAKGTIFNLYIPFVAFVSYVYSQDQVLVVASVLIMQVLYTPFSILIADKVITKDGTKCALILGCVLLELCMLLRCAINYWFYAILLASVVGAIGRPLLMNIPAKLSFEWFSPEGRVASTSIATLAANLGGAIGNFLPLFFIDDQERDKGKGKAMIFNASVVEALVFSVIFLIAMFLFVEKSSASSSEQSPEEHKESPISQLLALIKNKNIRFLMAIFCLQAICLMALQVNSSLILKAFGMESATTVVLLGAAYLLAGLIGSAIQAYILGKTKRYKATLIAVTVGTIVSYVLVLLSFASKSTVLIVIAASALGIFNVPALILIIEFSCEVSYPVDGAVVNGLINSCGQVLGFISSLVSASILDESLSSGVIFGVISSIVLSFCIPLCFFVKEDLRRIMHANGEILDNDI